MVAFIDSFNNEQYEVFTIKERGQKKTGLYKVLVFQKGNFNMA